MAPSQPRTKRNMITTEKKAKAVKRRDQLSFSKRRNGLFNKVTELSILCQSETALIVTSKNDGAGGGEVFVCGYPSPDAVIRRFLTGERRQRQEVEGEKVEALYSEYEAVQERLKEEQRKLIEITEEQQRRGSVFPSMIQLQPQMMVAAPPPAPQPQAVAALPPPLPVQDANFGGWVPCAHRVTKFTPVIESNFSSNSTTLMIPRI